MIKLVKDDTMIVVINNENLLENENFVGEIKKIYLKENSSKFILNENYIQKKIKFLSLVGDSDLIVDYLKMKVNV